MTKQIILTQGKRAIVDDADYEWLSRWKWTYLTAGGYAYRQGQIRGGQHMIRMHRLILDAPAGMEVDHINGNGLDNRRSNLRLATHSQNQNNRGPSIRSTSGFKGVCRNPGYTRKWRASIKVNGRRIALGYFHTAEEAARAYDVAQKQYFGDYARLNFPD